MSFSSNVLKSLVPITQFNRGQASKIFERLNKENHLIVLKNNQPAAIILSPEEYSRMQEIEENYQLLLEAAERLEKNTKPHITMNELLSELGISQKELDDAEDVVVE